MTPDPAMLVTRLAVLLEAGAAPLDACRLVAEADPEGPLAAAAQAESAAAVPASLAAGGSTVAWRGVAVAWRVAVEAGTPLAPMLHRMVAVLRALEDARRDADVALAGPRASARIVIALPPLGLAFGQVLGLGPVAALLGSPPGWALLAGGVLLLAAGSRWSRRLVARARRSDPLPGLSCDLLALAMMGGMSVPAARALVAEAWREAGLPADADDGSDDVLGFATRAGVPVARLLRGEGDRRRADAVVDARRRSAELGSRLLLPLGVCILPSFVMLGVAPTLLALLSSTLVVR